MWLGWIFKARDEILVRNNLTLILITFLAFVYGRFFFPSAYKTEIILHCGSTNLKDKACPTIFLTYVIGNLILIFFFPNDQASSCARSVNPCEMRIYG